MDAHLDVFLARPRIDRATDDADTAAALDPQFVYADFGEAPSAVLECDRHVADESRLLRTRRDSP